MPELRSTACLAIGALAGVIYAGNQARAIAWETADRVVAASMRPPPGPESPYRDPPPPGPTGWSGVPMSMPSGESIPNIEIRHTDEPPRNRRGTLGEWMDRREGRWKIAVLCLAPLLCALFGLGSGCTVAACQRPTSAAEVADATRYGSDLMRCVEEAGTMDESRACRQAVESRWAPLIAQLRALDGGTE